MLLRTSVNSSGIESDSRTFVFGNYIDEVLMMRQPTGTEYLYGHDHLYSPAVLFDAAGTVVRRYEYDVYGRMRPYSATWGSVPWPAWQILGNYYAFTGRELDRVGTSQTGILEIMYYRARYYDPDTGRFLQPDPLGYIDGMNLYQYADSCPIIYADPTGYFFVWPKPNVSWTYTGKGCSLTGNLSYNHDTYLLSAFFEGSVQLNISASLSLSSESRNDCLTLQPRPAKFEISGPSFSLKPFSVSVSVQMKTPISSGYSNLNMSSYSDGWYSWGVKKTCGVGVSAGILKVWVSSLPCPCRCVLLSGGLNVSADIKENMFVPSVIAGAAAIAAAPYAAEELLTAADAMLRDILYSGAKVLSAF